MKVIRGRHAGALCISWGIMRCNQLGCTNKPSTIVRVPADESPTGEGITFGLCEDHYQWGARERGGVTYDLVFDDYDAFGRNHANNRD